ncbi:response regulator [Ohtaekwangia koreensis]|uniref:DNA-binding response regulator, OmpR family, contains REC and winged-helix (WHTH) domain n=1 Tax=Ohtaekwangia koreensis TaxID=688867 RepID=A0A1T5JAS6_9BACT|nr:response regulator transcription factor [Ohtaekwangia koreensis]SKC48489.1 DNA-binding response regulator, OmpR family, contains REC and winged-helix (wHTH) domain [Ohtaekwangia koreensis]
MKLLIVEDETKVAEVLKRGLTEAGYEADVAFDGQIGLRLAKTGSYDLVLLDINLPLLNGLELCKQLRETDEVTPVLMLTALGMSDDIVAGLDAGADDYLPKPFRFNELYARIKALTRRKKIYTAAAHNGQSVHEDKFTLADLEIDFDAREVKRSGKVIQLTAKEYALLEYLARNAGKVRSRLEIAESVWGLNFETGTNFIDVYINYVRNKVDKPFNPKLIHTVTGFGYILKLPEA